MANSYSGDQRVTEGETPDVLRARRESESMQDEASSRNRAENIVARLRQSLPKDTVVQGSFEKGGVVPKTGAYQLHEGETVVANPDETQPNSQDPQDAQAAAAPEQQNAPAPDGQDASNLPEDDESTVAGEGVNIQKAFSKMQAALVRLLDNSGVRRMATVPYVDGETTASHVQAVSQVLAQAGGFTQNLLHSYHHATGKGWGSGDGATAVHNADKLRETVIVTDNPDAIAALAAAHRLLNLISGLIGDTKSVTVANSQLALVGKNKGTGMTLLDFSIALQNLVSPPIQELARMHHDTKSHGPNHLLLTSPRS